MIKEIIIRVFKSEATFSLHVFVRFYLSWQGSIGVDCQVIWEYFGGSECLGGHAGQCCILNFCWGVNNIKKTWWKLKKIEKNSTNSNDLSPKSPHQIRQLCWWLQIH